MNECCLSLNSTEFKISGDIDIPNIRKIVDIIFKSQRSQDSQESQDIQDIQESQDTQEPEYKASTKEREIFFCALIYLIGTKKLKNSRNEIIETLKNDSQIVIKALKNKVLCVHDINNTVQNIIDDDYYLIPLVRGASLFVKNVKVNYKEYIFHHSDSSELISKIKMKAKHMGGFSHVDKWNPADIVLVHKTINLEEILDHNGNIESFNEYFNGLINDNLIIPISQKLNDRANMGALNFHYNRDKSKYTEQDIIDVLNSFKDSNFSSVFVENDSDDTDDSQDLIDFQDPQDSQESQGFKELLDSSGFSSVFSDVKRINPNNLNVHRELLNKDPEELNSLIKQALCKTDLSSNYHYISDVTYDFHDETEAEVDIKQVFLKLSGKSAIYLNVEIKDTKGSHNFIVEIRNKTKEYNSYYIHLKRGQMRLSSYIQIK